MTQVDSGDPGGAESIGYLAQRACELEASAPKPGNVSPGRPFVDVRFEDFVASAEAIRDAMSGAGRRPLGQTIWLAVETTSLRTRANTNLGIILLLAPLARAASQVDLAIEPSERLRRLRMATGRVLDETTVDDARNTYRAIRLANPGGLGTAAEQDVSSDPSATLRDVMCLAADRDGVAREYATSFETTFERSAPALMRARAGGLAWNEAIVETYLTVLPGAPHTHPPRRPGQDRKIVFDNRLVPGSAQRREPGDVGRSGGRRDFRIAARGTIAGTSRSRPGRGGALSGPPLRGGRGADLIRSAVDGTR